MLKNTAGGAPTVRCGIKIALLGAFGLFIVSGYAQAQTRVSALTEGTITEFINQTTEITTGRARYMNEDQIKKYLDAHIHDKANFRSTMAYNVPGYPTQENSLSLDKDEFIGSIKDGRQSVEGYETEVSIDEIKIAKDGRNATVLTTASEQGFMPLPDGSGGTKDVPMVGQSKCAQILRLSKAKIIQMFNATCKTEIRFEE